MLRLRELLRGRIGGTLFELDVEDWVAESTDELPALYGAAFVNADGPLVVLGFLERYLARQIELGRMRRHDPRGAARALMGMLVVYAVGREILPPIRSGFPEADDYARQVVDIFLGGLRNPELP